MFERQKLSEKFLPLVFLKQPIIVYCLKAYDLCV